MSSWIDVGCVGGSCGKKERCRRYKTKDERSIVMQNPPYMKGVEGNHCNYYEHYKTQEEDRT